VTSIEYALLPNIFVFRPGERLVVKRLGDSGGAVKVYAKSFGSRLAYFQSV